MKKKIKNLAELKEEKQKLKLKREASKQMMLDSFKNTRNTAIDHLTSKVLLPTAIAGLGAWAISVLVADKKEKSNEGEKRKATADTIFQNLVPIGIKLATAYMSNKMKEEPEV